jgi:hypothetical protein
MSRIILPGGDFSTNRVGVEPASTIVDLDLWAYLNTSLAASPNLVTDVALAQTGTVPFSAGYATITPGTNYLSPTGLLDVADQTIMFVVRTSQIGGNYSPVITAYSGGVGLFIAVGWTYLRIHVSGYGAIGNFTFSSTYGNEWSFWSVTLEDGHATPIRVKNWTYNETVTGGTAAGNRSSTGQQLTVAAHTIATFGTFAGDTAFIGRAKSVMSDTEVESCYDSVRLSLPEFGITGV